MPRIRRSRFPAVDGHADASRLPPQRIARMCASTPACEQGDEISAVLRSDDRQAHRLGRDTRVRARARMRRALAQYRIVGVANNIEFLARLIASESFVRGDLDTELIAREGEHLFKVGNKDVPDDVLMLAALAELLREAAAARDEALAGAEPDSPWNVLDGWRLGARAKRIMSFDCGDIHSDVAGRTGSWLSSAHRHDRHGRRRRAREGFARAMRSWRTARLRQPSSPRDRDDTCSPRRVASSSSSAIRCMGRPETTPPNRQ